MKRKQTSIRLTQQAKTLIQRLSRKLGINQTSVIELAIRVMAEKENVTRGEKKQEKPESF